MVDTCWLLPLLLLGMAVTWVAWCRQPSQPGNVMLQTTVHRPGALWAKPCTPDDCPACHHQGVTLVGNRLLHPPVTPWQKVKTHRGAPKCFTTDGFACPNRRCIYYRITDGQVHALVGDGTHGKHERIQRLRCQACTTTFRARRNTPRHA
jgi:hypothetical protein